MKTAVITFALLFIFSLAVVSKVEAYPFIEVTGKVTPDESSIINSTISGVDFVTLDATYVFTVTAADLGARMNNVSLEFEGDVFTAVNSVSGYDPSDWNGILFTSSAGNRYQFSSAGTTLGVSDTLSLTANVTMYSDALDAVSGDWDGDGSINSWSEGQIWGQSFSARDTLGGSDGGSTTTVTPEPGTIALLGIGLAGLAGAGMRKHRKRKTATTKASCNV